VELQQSLPKLRQQGLGVAAISYDSVAVLKNFADRKGITYPLLSDADSKVIRSFGLLNESVDKESAQYGIPYPGTFILDPNGVVTRKYFESDFRDRYTASEILVRQYGDAAGFAREVVTTKHLELTTSASLAVVHMGERLALVAEIDLKPGMHVYAPGVEGYIPIDFKLAATPAFQAHGAEYPRARKLHLPAIGETVPVYEGRFRVVDDITIGPDAQVKPLLTPAGDLVVEGSLRYQACDAKICYPPQSVPMHWTLRYEALDRQRVPPELQRRPPQH
jgi:hypothetical protein